MLRAKRGMRQEESMREESISHHKPHTHTPSQTSLRWLEVTTAAGRHKTANGA
jgi:hypothetical protein